MAAPVIPTIVDTNATYLQPESATILNGRLSTIIVYIRKIRRRCLINLIQVKLNVFYNQNKRTPITKTKLDMDLIRFRIRNHMLLYFDFQRENRVQAYD